MVIPYDIPCIILLLVHPYKIHKYKLSNASNPRSACSNSRPESLQLAPQTMLWLGQHSRPWKSNLRLLWRLKEGEFLMLQVRLFDLAKGVEMGELQEHEEGRCETMRNNVKQCETMWNNVKHERFHDMSWLKFQLLGPQGLCLRSAVLGVNTHHWQQRWPGQELEQNALKIWTSKGDSSHVTWHVLAMGLAWKGTLLRRVYAWNNCHFLKLNDLSTSVSKASPRLVHRFPFWNNPWTLLKHIHGKTTHLSSQVCIWRCSDYECSRLFQ